MANLFIEWFTFHDKWLNITIARNKSLYMGCELNGCDILILEL